MMKHSKCVISVALCLLAIPAVSLWGWSMTPTLVCLDPNQPQTFYSVSSEKNEKPAAIEITVSKREINEMGEEILSDASNEFLIYPSHVVLKENSTKNIRVIWKGKKEDLREEKAYRIIATSLPVNVAPIKEEGNEDEVGINIAIATRYLNSLYITPAKAKSDVKCTKTYLDDNGGKGKRVVIELINSGNAHQYIADLSFTAQNVSEKIVVTKEMIKKEYPEGINILANHKRNLYVPIK